jgi:hypothetical protein
VSSLLLLAAVMISLVKKIVLLTSVPKLPKTQHWLRLRSMRMGIVFQEPLLKGAVAVDGEKAAHKPEVRLEDAGVVVAEVDAAVAVVSGVVGAQIRRLAQVFLRQWVLRSPIAAAVETPAAAAIRAAEMAAAIPATAAIRIHRVDLAVLNERLEFYF